MGLFDLFRRKKSAPLNLTPDELRDQLFAAAADRTLLLQLCKQHRDAILIHFTDWRIVPIERRNDRALAEPYIHGLIGVAETFAQHLGNSSLLDLLMKPAGNPLNDVDAVIDRASELQNNLDYAPAIEMLTNQLIELREIKIVTGNHSPHGLLHGALGHAYFNSGEPAKALSHHEQALRLCREIGDVEGVRVYHQSLYEVHRYLSQSEQAAVHADALAELLAESDPARAARCETLAKLARLGEPLNRVILRNGGLEMEVSEFQTITGDARIQLVFARNRPTLGLSQQLMARGRALGEANDQRAALADFHAAARADAFNPEPHYLAGQALCMMERHSDAAAEYETTEALAPGWYHVRSNLWLAREVAADRLDHATLLGIWFVEDANSTPAEQVDWARKLVDRAPAVPHVHLALGQALAGAEQIPQAIAAFRQGLSLDPEPDARTRLLLGLAHRMEAGAERTELLQQAAEVNGNLISAATARLLLKQG